jgi:hypothetical protein
MWSERAIENIGRRLPVYSCRSPSLLIRSPSAHQLLAIPYMQTLLFAWNNINLTSQCLRRVASFWCSNKPPPAPSLEYKTQEWGVVSLQPISSTIQFLFAILCTDKISPNLPQLFSHSNKTNSPFFLLNVCFAVFTRILKLRKKD